MIIVRLPCGSRTIDRVPLRPPHPLPHSQTTFSRDLALTFLFPLQVAADPAPLTLALASPASATAYVFAASTLSYHRS
jgi:hypothetical protein